MLVIVVMLLIASVLNTISHGLDYGSLKTRHYASEFEYIKLGYQCRDIIAKPKRNRAAADVTTMEIRMSLVAIAKSAPDI